MKFKQLILPVPWALSKRSSDFIINPCNSYAFKWLEKWPLKVQGNFACLVGEKGAGKTHLANIWAERMNAYIMNPPLNVFDRWYNTLFECEEQRFFVLDDADEVEEEMSLFYIYNTIKDKNAYILMTAKTPPNKWKLSLNDVKSRVSTMNVIQIQRPDEDAMKLILKKMFSQRGILVKDNIVDYIVNRIERSYESINYWINRIDRNLLDKKLGASLHSIRDIIKQR
ncbi:MAG: hypothetical protein LBB34_01810 [Holosporales bacterium]|jgi:chromosomal replication initiation ATPase DnaA|nr:hypothetical protein [Holosporales bacterium]